MIRRILLALVAAFIAVAPARAQPQEGLLFFAAASLTDVLQDINKLWEAKGEARVRFNFAASSTLARQMERGAVATFPAELTEPIAYPFAVTKAGDTPAARRFLQFLSSPAAQEAFTRRGFITE